MAGRGQASNGQPRDIRPWRDDQQVLERIQQVVQMRSRGASAIAIAKELGCSERTVRYDLERGRELARGEILYAVEDHLSALDDLIEQNWVAFHGSRDQSLNRSALLANIRQCLEAKAKAAGLLIERREVTGKDGGPIEIDDARERLASRIAELAARAASSGGAESPS